MDKKIIDASSEFGMQLQKYLDHFSLFPADIAYLLNSNSNSIEKILSGDKEIYLKTVEKIASFFGLDYYEMGNPDFPFPSYTKLPENTKIIITKREKEGPPKQYGDHDLNKALDVIFKGNFLKEPRTSKEISAKLPDSIPENARTASRVTDAIKKGKWDKLVAILPEKHSGQNVYQLIKYVGK